MGEGVGTCRSWQKLRSSAKRQRAPVSTLCMAENARKASASSSASSRKKEREIESKRQTIRKGERGGSSAVGVLGVCSVGVSAGSTKNGS